MYNSNRIPRNYDGTGVTSRKITDFLPNVLQTVHKMHKDRPDLILAAWPRIIGAQLYPMTQALSFTDGILTVSVKNSTLYSLLNQHEKPKILRALRQQFPKVNIRTIIFRMS